MNQSVPLLEKQSEDGRVRVVYLDPTRYDAYEQAYIAARTTRTFDDPDKILGKAASHLSRWAQGKPNPAWEHSSHVGRSVVAESMEAWLYQEIVVPRHDSVLEFAGASGMVWVGGVSLATLRDVDRHRLFSFEEYTTRALSENLKEYLEELAALETTQILGGAEMDLLHGLFYTHPERWQLDGIAETHYSLRRAALQLYRYISRVLAAKEQDKKRAEDIYRADLPMALRTPFCMAANPRAWGEALGKRTCYREGHREYVDLFRLLGELLHPVLPLIVDVACRWCPQGFGKFDHGCCRHRWEQQLLNPGG